VAGSRNGLSPASASASTLPSVTPSPVLVLTLGTSVVQTLMQTAEREGLDLNALATGLLLLGLGKQSALVVARKPRVVTDDEVPDIEVATVCLSCARARTDPRQTACPACGGSWTTAIR
jgi:hypothetical protein